MGKVYILGAGPGDKDYISVKGMKLLKQADCIMYDRLIDPQLLSYAREDCECIYVGKKSSEHTLLQDEINHLLYQKAKEYELVVRLKGGDPYVLGRGGEEALYLFERETPFEVIPGICSAIAGLGSAGIPITHRGLSYGMHIISAHLQKDGLTKKDYQAMVSSNQTLVFMMGLSQIHTIVQNLLTVGMDEDTPIAIISNACRPSQKTLVSTLSEIEHESKIHLMISPALIVVGKVVSLHEKLNYFERRTLFGLRILLPKAGRGSSELADKLKEHGGNVTLLQTSDIIERKDALINICLKDYQYLIFTSRYSVRFFFKQLKQKHIDLRELTGISIAAVGEQTAKVIEEYGIHADIVPNIYNSDHLYECLKRKLQKSDAVLFPKAWGSDSSLSEKLREIAHIKEVYLYENKQIKFHNIPVDDFHMIIFTCSSCVHHVMKAYQTIQLKDKKIISIGAKTSQTLREYGITHYVEAARATFDEVVKTVLYERGDMHVL